MYSNTNIKVRDSSIHEKELVAIIKSKYKTEFLELEDVRNECIGEMLLEAYKQGFKDCVSIIKE